MDISKLLVAKANDSAIEAAHSAVLCDDIPVDGSEERI